MLRAKYIVERIRERAEPWSTLMLVLNAREEKLFQVYVVEQLEW